MKKVLTILIAAMLVLGMLIAGSSAVTEDMLIGREVSIEGVGTVNADIELATQPYCGGLELSESISTPGGGFAGESLMQYSSSFEVGMWNITGNATGDIEYSSNAKLLNIKRNAYMKNYDIGAVMSFKLQGDSENEVAFFTDDQSMEAEIRGEIVGELSLFQKVVSTKDHHTFFIRDVIDLVGNYKYDWSAYAEKNEYPAAGGNEWLNCP